ncbi:hypothetical protein V8C35DRAFT_318870 [Trichoderma chlorosporum]
MLILQSSSVGLSGDVSRALGNIQGLAQQVICYVEDMEYVPGRLDLMKIPPSLLPKTCMDLDHLLHENKDIQDFLNAFANQNNFTIEVGRLYLGPDIIWLRGGDILAKENHISFLTVLQRPKSKGAEVHQTSVQEPPSSGIIERPIGEECYVHSSFRCQVGDVIILEGGERLRLRMEADIEPRSVCLLAILHQIQWKDRTDRNL